MVEAIEHQTPNCMTLWTLISIPSNHGSGKGEKASTVMQTIAKPINRQCCSGSAVRRRK